MSAAACCAYEPSAPQHATMARDGNFVAWVAMDSRIESTRGDSPRIARRWRAFEMANSVENSWRTPFSSSGPTAAETRERIPRSRAESPIGAPLPRFAFTRGLKVVSRADATPNPKKDVRNLWFITEPGESPDRKIFHLDELEANGWADGAYVDFTNRRASDEPFPLTLVPGTSVMVDAGLNDCGFAGFTVTPGLSKVAEGVSSA